MQTGNPLWEAHLPGNFTPVGYGKSVIITNKHNVVWLAQCSPLPALLLIASLGHCPHFLRAAAQKSELCRKLLMWSSNLTLVKGREDRTDTESEWRCMRKWSVRQWDNWWGAVELPAEHIQQGAQLKEDSAEEWDFALAFISMWEETKPLQLKGKCTHKRWGLYYLFFIFDREQWEILCFYLN